MRIQHTRFRYCVPMAFKNSAFSPIRYWEFGIQSVNKSQVRIQGSSPKCHGSTTLQETSNHINSNTYTLGCTISSSLNKSILSKEHFLAISERTNLWFIFRLLLNHNQYLSTQLNPTLSGFISSQLYTSASGLMGGRLYRPASPQISLPHLQTYICKKTQ